MGSSSSSASREAQRAEDERRRQIEATQKRIESIFGSDSREREILGFEDAARKLLTTDLNRTHGDNQRQLKFALARSATAGGSNAVDQGQRLNEGFIKAIIEADRRARTAGAGLRNADQTAKLNLFNQALGGLDINTASANALAAIRNNTKGSSLDASERNFDSFFRDVAGFVKTSREEEEFRRANEQIGSIFGPRPIIKQSVAGAE